MKTEFPIIKIISYLLEEEKQKGMTILKIKM